MKTNPKIPLPTYFLLPGSTSFLTLLPPSYLPGGTGGWGINFASNASSCSHSSPTPVWGPSHRRFSTASWTAPMWVLMGCSYSSTAWAWVFSSWYIPSGVGCSSMGSPQDCRSYQKIFSSVDSSAWTMAPARNLLCHGVPMGCTEHPPILVSSTVPQWGYLLHYGLLHGLPGTPCSSIWSIPFTPILTPLSCCTTFLTLS